MPYSIRPTSEIETEIGALQEQIGALNLALAKIDVRATPTLETAERANGIRRDIEKVKATIAELTREGRLSKLHELHEAVQRAKITERVADAEAQDTFERMSEALKPIIHMSKLRETVDNTEDMMNARKKVEDTKRATVKAVCERERHALMSNLYSEMTALITNTESKS